MIRILTAHVVLTDTIENVSVNHFIELRYLNRKVIKGSIYLEIIQSSYLEIIPIRPQLSILLIQKDLARNKLIF